MKTRAQLLIIIILLINNLYSQTELYTHKFTQSTSSYQLWTAPPSVKIFKTDAVPTASSSELKVYAAGNEFEPCLVIVKPTSSGSVTISMGSFGSGITTELNYVKYINVATATDQLGKTGANPDPLVPIVSGGSLTLTANENTAIWITINVPKNTPMGDYTANFTIAGINVPIKLHVFNFNVPDDLHLESQMNYSDQTILTKYGVSGTGADYWMYVDKIKQWFIDHRLTGRSPLWSGGLTTTGGACYIDYDCNGTITDNDGIWGFEKPAERYLNGNGLMNGTFTTQFNDGKGFPSFQAMTFQNNDASADQRPSTFCSLTRSSTDWYTSNNPTSAYNQKWFQYITTIQNYLTSKGLINKAYYYLANEPQNQAGYDAIAWYSRYLKQAATNLKLMVSEEPKPEIYNNTNYVGNHQIDIWLPVLQNYNSTISHARKTNNGEDTWIYFLHSTRPPYFNPITLDHQGMESKLLGWLLWKYRIKGIAYYSLNNWSSNTWTTPAPSGSNGHNGDVSMFYPPSETNANIAFGSNGHRFVPSIRFELMRDAFEDYEYLYMLSGGQPQVGTTNVSDAYANKMISSPTSFTRDDEYLYNMRRLIGLKIGGEIATIPDINPTPEHWRSQETPRNYYINFQDPAGLPTTTSTQTIDGQTYKYYLFGGKNYLQIGTNNYDRNLGYGWYAPNDVHWMMKYDQWFDNGNELQKSVVYSDYGRKATFEFCLPNGNYNITVSIGHRATYRKQYVTVEGVEFFKQDTTSNSCKIKAFPVKITDNKLTLEIGAPENNEYTMLNYLTAEHIPTNIEEISKNDIFIYPNPANNFINIESNFKFSFILKDITGKIIIQKQNLNNNYKLDLNNLKSGIYFISIFYNSKQITKKIVVTK